MEKEQDQQKREQEWAEKATEPGSPGGQEVTMKEAVEGAVETQPDLAWERKLLGKDKEESER